MSKINFDYDRLQNRVIPSMEEVCSKLDNARNTINNSYIPDDCAYRTYLNNFGSYIYSINQRINRVKDWINSSNRSMEDALDSASSKVSSINIAKISRK